MKYHLWMAAILIFVAVLVSQLSSYMSREEKEPVLRAIPSEYITRVRVVYNEDGTVKKKLLFLQQL